jgi:hypothetical protein
VQNFGLVGSIAAPFKSSDAQPFDLIDNPSYLTITKHFQYLPQLRSSTLYPSNPKFPHVPEFRNPHVESRPLRRHILNLIAPLQLSVIFGSRSIELGRYPAGKYC